MKLLLQSLALALALGTLPATVMASPAVCRATAKEVAYVGNRVHLRCDNFYFAVPTSDWMAALQFTSMAGQVGNGKWGGLEIHYDWWADASWFGCAKHDCRQALSWKLVP